MTDAKNRRWTCLLSASLAVAVLIVFWPAMHCGFVYFDDPDYVTENPHVRSGLTWAGLRWALTGYAAYWHPLTWISHMADIQMYGMNPAGHHLTSVLFHLLNSVLFFLLLRRMTGALWRSAFVAGMFALHPLRVESVVWIAERKDVLSTFFWMLTLWAYVRYVEERGGAAAKSRAFYTAAVLMDALGLMSKPTLVTMPLVLLLLDYWPLRRFPPFSAKLVVEKVPFAVLTLASGIITSLEQKQTGAIVSLAQFSIPARIASAPLAYIAYLAKNFWPVHLAAFYPHPQLEAGQVIGACLLLGLITGLALWRARSEPYLAVGWFWFLIVLFPVIGLVQSGGQFIADRFSYVPTAGIWIMVAWGLHDLAAARPVLRRFVAISGAVALGACALLTWRHVGVYRNTETLWDATLCSQPDCMAAHYNLSKWFLKIGRYDDAIAHCRTILDSLPGDPAAEGILAEIRLRQGKFAEAADAFEKLLALRPNQPEAWCNLGFALLQTHHVPEAVAAYEKALQLKPDYALAHNDLGNILLRLGRPDAALEHFTRAAELVPDFAEAHYNIAQILLYQGRTNDALVEYQKALASQPNLTAARTRISEILQRQREGQ
ncbi:MAG TPA: tetratricopeptide repeat protein [Candidatus Saccharimonadales bacterium]|nr:tetratricopeptide repeat protein [Candidatus Saccharimonadales bacterium]